MTVVYSVNAICYCLINQSENDPVCVSISYWLPYNVNAILYCLNSQSEMVQSVCLVSIQGNKNQP